MLYRHFTRVLYLNLNKTYKVNKLVWIISIIFQKTISIKKPHLLRKIKQLYKNNQFS